MRIFKGIGISVLILSVITGVFYPLAAQESYEDYRTERDRKNRKYPAGKKDYVRREKPLSEVRAAESDGFLDDLRGAVREEIDTTISKERKASKKVINENKLIGDIRKIVKEEIEDAISIRDKKYLAPFTFEAGGYISAQFKGMSSDENDNNTRFKIIPIFNFFFMKNFGIGLHGEADINITTGSQNYNVGAGPIFAFGLDKQDQFCFYTSIFAGMSYNSEVGKSIGFRYGNEVGLKFVLTSGVILNLGIMLAFDNAGDGVTGFQNIYLPVIGITAWF